MKTVHLMISGRVQGVYFRASAQKTAIIHNLTGWVRNFNDDVEAVISGKDESVEEFIAWCHLGPERAVVKKVETEELPYKEFKGFIIKR
ncbi:MAG: acylphosphatase [Chitinophagaceae bacterium]|nr:acylphosphatase [Chitinophagaceae bacterium]